MAFHLFDTNPAEVAFWSGAGISAMPPTSLPLGDALTQAITESYCGVSTWSEIKAELAILGIRDDAGLVKQAPRLESTLETLLASMGPSCLELLRVLDRPSNSAHNFFSTHLASGGDHITLNLDDCIAQSLRDLHSGSRVAIIDALQDHDSALCSADPMLVHIHGRIPSGRAPTSALGLGVRTISAGLSSIAKLSIERVLGRRAWLVVVGYSGRDYFDVNPYLRELSRASRSYRDLSILWVNYAKRGDLSSIRPYATGSCAVGSLFLESFMACGAAGWICDLDPRSLYDELARAWSMPRNPISQDLQLSSEAVRAHAASVSSDQMRLNAAALWVSMGFGEKAERELRHIDRLNPLWSHHCSHPWGFSSNEHLAAFLTNEARRERGLYRSATKALNRATWREGVDPLIRLHREGGDRWLEGRAFAAYVLFVCGLRAGIRMGDRFPNYDVDEINANLIEASVRLLHLYRDASKHSAVIRYLFGSGVNLALNVLAGENPRLTNLLYDVWHLNRLGKELSGGVANRVSLLCQSLPFARASVFPETDNVLGYVNTKRFQLTCEMSEHDVSKWAELVQLSTQIGDLPGVVKAMIGMARIRPLDISQKHACRQAILAIEWSWIVKRRCLAALANA